MRLQCNKTLAAGSTLTLTDKLDLSGSPDQCGIFGPTGDEPATIVVPAKDCVLHAQGEVTIRGNVRFLVGHRSKKFDCCDDGEGHGGILCSDSNLTIAEKALVTIATTDDAVVLNPGAFWTGSFIHVDGTVNATLQYGQMTGLNGVLSSSSMRVSANGHVIASGMKVARGVAIQGGDGGTVLEGTVECSDYHASDVGGCVAAGRNFSFLPSGIIRATNGHSVGGVGVVLCGGGMADLQGTIIASNITTQNAGAVFAGDAITMSGKASIHATNVYAGGGSAVISSGPIILQDEASVRVNGSWGGDSGAIGGKIVQMSGNTKLWCANAYADGAGGCIGSTIHMSDNAAITAQNVTSKTLGGAIAGGYPGQHLVVSGNVTIDVDGSSAGLYGGAFFFWANMTFGNGAFQIRIRNTASPCGGALATLNGKNDVYLDTTFGGELTIENARELDATADCETVYANLVSGTPSRHGPRISQPCGKGCAVPVVPPSCGCGSQKGKFIECCG